MDVQVHYRTTVVRGHEIFYREAGDPGAPVLLLHGYPTSSHMFRDLIPRLAGRYRLVAPDHLGFGYSATPSVDEFDYTFANLAEVTGAFAEQLGLSRFALYVQDYGRAHRLAASDRPPRAHHRDRHSERQRLPRGAGRAGLGPDLRLHRRPEPGHRGRGAPLLATWRAHDEIFGPDGARAFQRDLPDAEVHLLPTGHFALESHRAQIARLINDFLDRKVATAAPRSPGSSSTSHWAPLACTG